MTSASTVDYDSADEEENERMMADGTQRVCRDILWAFTNVDKMKKDFWNRLESRLLDIY